jgi:predicted Zn finger-like uncharacterized protein
VALTMARSTVRQAQALGLAAVLEKPVRIAMLIVCPTCASEYNVDAAHMGSEGRRVRCTSCHTDWFALPEAEPLADVSTRSPERANTDLGGRSAQDFIEDEWQRAAETDEQVAQAAQMDAAQMEMAQMGPVNTDAAMPDDPEQPSGHDPDSTLADGGASEGDTATGPPQARPRRKGGSRTQRGAKPPSRGGWGWRGISLAGKLSACAALLLAAGLWQRQAIVAHAPALAAPLQNIGLGVNIRGLVFEAVQSELVNDPSGRFLVVQSTVQNVTGRTAPVPPIEVVIRDKAGKPVYTWASEPPKVKLEPGESLSFRTRLAAPPPEGHDVMLRFQRASGQMALAQK